MNIAVILAGGKGTRVGSEIPKQFIKVYGKPILVYTIEIFQQHSEIDAIEIVCIEQYMDYMKEIIKEYKLTKVKWVVQGGKDFQHSVLNGVANLKQECREEDTVLIHFGASPFVKDYIISDAIRVCAKRGNAISTTPFYLLSGIKEDNVKSTKWIDRDTVACMNSPHAFKYGVIKRIYEEAEERGIIEQVEPHTTTLMYMLEKPIYFSKGSQSNIKITTKEDIELFEGYVLRQKRDGYKNGKNNCYI